VVSADPRTGVENVSHKVKRVEGAGGLPSPQQNHQVLAEPPAARITNVCQPSLQLGVARV
jgi:hypothetical protein